MGNKKAHGALIYQYDLGRSALGLKDFPLYLGVSAEAGNVWLASESMKYSSLISSGSVYVGTDTAMGPIALGYGLTDTQEHSFYFYLGKNF